MDRWMSWWVRGVFGVVGLISLATSPALAFEVSFAGGRAVVEGVPSGSSVAVAWVAREPKGYYQRVVVDSAVVADDDGDGVVSVELDASLERLGPKTLLAVVEISSGEWLLAAPPGGAVSLEDAAGRLDPGPGGGLSQWTTAKESVLLLAVRPGEGAWSGRAFDGGGGDADLEADGSLSAALDGLAVLSGGSGAALSRLGADDVLIALDPHLMTASVWDGRSGGTVPSSGVSSGLGSTHLASTGSVSVGQGEGR